uniref:Uncharacterized protein n=1 Tax=Eutreptiella gymnastica TaxID=73025 RepID=A0A7S4FNU8_9EUGL
MPHRIPRGADLQRTTDTTDTAIAQPNFVNYSFPCYFFHLLCTFSVAAALQVSLEKWCVRQIGQMITAWGQWAVELLQCTAWGQLAVELLQCNTPSRSCCTNKIFCIAMYR